MKCPFLIIFFLAIVFPLGLVFAQETTSETQYPTVRALEDTIIPAADRVALARSYLGVTDIPEPPTTPPSHKLGDEALFWAGDLSANESFQVTATLRVIGEHIYLWVENGAGVLDSDLQGLADAFDQRIYNQVRELWGSEAIPGIDGDARVHGLFTTGIGNRAAAYFSSQHLFPQEIVATSNQREMFFFNLDAVTFELGADYMESVIAHEFQHMIRANVDLNDSSWMDEGFSTFTEQYLGYADAAYWAVNFFAYPNTQLNTWSKDQFAAAHYGAAFMFIAYFYERYGLEGTQALSSEPTDGLESVDHVLQAMGESGVNDLFADWVIANMVMDANIEGGRYGYRLVPMTSRPAFADEVNTYPYSVEGMGNQYGTDYYAFNELGGKSSLSITIDVPDTVQLVPVNAASGQWMWYSNKNDQSDTTLTRAFDLSGVPSATLNYNIWYSLEDLWDYAYVSVSTDDGTTWKSLAAPHTTENDPNDNAYGAGYTGDSGNWVKEEVSLNEYAGQEILVRFEMITDDAVVQTGVVIDDVAIPEIGYSSDFEGDNGGWEAQGWIHTDNGLPQQVWVQAIQQASSGTSITRWLAPQQTSYTLPLKSDVNRVILAVSPFAPVTTVSIPYTLSVSD